MEFSTWLRCPFSCKNKFSPDYPTGVELLLIFAYFQHGAQKPVLPALLTIIHLCSILLFMGNLISLLNLAMVLVFIISYFISCCWLFGNRGNHRLIRSRHTSLLDFSFTTYLTLHWIRHVCIFLLSCLPASNFKTFESRNCLIQIFSFSFALSTMPGTWSITICWIKLHSRREVRVSCYKKQPPGNQHWTKNNLP